MKYLIGFKTIHGTVFIAQAPDGWYHPLWRDQSLGRYPSVAAALDDVAGGHTHPPSDGTDMGSLEISRDIGFWEPAASLM